MAPPQLDSKSSERDYSDGESRSKQVGGKLEKYNRKSRATKRSARPIFLIVR